MKDQTALKSTKGRILLQFTLFWNPLRAAWKAINPKDKKFVKQENKFKRLVFLYNVNRLKSILMDVYFLMNYVRSCFQWDSKLRSISAIIVFTLSTYFFQPYMVPLFILGLFLKNYLRLYFSEQPRETELAGGSVDQNLYEENEDDEDDKVSPGVFVSFYPLANQSTQANLESLQIPSCPQPGKKTFKEKIQILQETSAQIQNVLGELASYAERVYK